MELSNRPVLSQTTAGAVASVPDSVDIVQLATPEHIVLAGHNAGEASCVLEQVQHSCQLAINVMHLQRKAT
jgi:hypothetical protein